MWRIGMLGFCVGLPWVAQAQKLGRLMNEREKAQIHTEVWILEPEDFQLGDPNRMALLLLIQAYKLSFSGSTASRCMFEPSCSAFAADALREQGMIAGLLLSADRLQRCHHGARKLAIPPKRNSDKDLIYDPACDY